MLKIRLMRIGAKKRPFYRVVAVDERNKRTGGYIELLGTYNPLTEPKEIKLKQDRIDYWTKQGAQPSDGFLRIIGKAPQRPARKPKKEKKEEVPAAAPVEKPAEEIPVETPKSSEPESEITDKDSEAGDGEEGSRREAAANEMSEDARRDTTRPSDGSEPAGPASEEPKPNDPPTQVEEKKDEGSA